MWADVKPKLNLAVSFNEYAEVLNRDNNEEGAMEVFCESMQTLLRNTDISSAASLMFQGSAGQLDLQFVQKNIATNHPKHVFKTQQTMITECVLYHVHIVVS
jgi:hypothetical protein